MPNLKHSEMGRAETNGRRRTNPPSSVVVDNRKTVKVFPETKTKLDIIAAAEGTPLFRLLDEMIDDRYRLAWEAGLLSLQNESAKNRYHDLFMAGYGEMWPPPGQVATKSIHLPRTAKQKVGVIAAAYGLSLAEAVGRMACLRYAEMIRQGRLPEVRGVPLA